MTENNATDDGIEEYGTYEDDEVVDVTDEEKWNEEADDDEEDNLDELVNSKEETEFADDE